MRYFSKARNGFFTSDVHGDNIPEDAVKVTEQEWQELVDGQSSGKIIAVGDDNRPRVSDPLPLTTEELAEQARKKRGELLSEMDVVISNPLRWGAFSPEKQQQYGIYRQELLAVPQQAGFPDNIVWPTTPQ